MKTASYVLAALFFCSGWATAEVTAQRSSAQEFSWSYSPGQPMTEQADTINPQGVFLEWKDAGFVICRNVIQPVRTFYIVVPPGTTPVLSISSARSTGRSQGLPGRPPRATIQTENPATAWAKLVGVEPWRGFRLARVEVALQTGDLRHSEVLQSISLTVQFQGTAAGFAATEREADMIKRIALNGKAAATWWQERNATGKIGPQTLSTQSWPGIDLYRLAVTETGLYEVTGTSVVGSNLVHQHINKIKVFGNGGHLLPRYPDAATDSVLKEDAILVEDRNGNGDFDPEDRVLFFGRGLKGADYCDSTDNTELRGQAHQSPYSTENMYFIGADPMGPDGLRMSAMATSGAGSPVTTSRAREYLDQDVFVFSTGDQPLSGVIWYMSTLGPVESRNYVMNLDGATGTAGTMTISLAVLVSTASPLKVYVGNTLVATLSVPETGLGAAPSRVTIQIPQGVLTPGNNVVRIENNSAATVYVNFIEISCVRDLVAPSGTVEFWAPQATGMYRYTVPELDQNGYMLDVSNPLIPRVAYGNTVVDSSYAESPRRYYALKSDHVRTPTYRGIKPANPTGLDYVRLRDTANEAQMIILTYDEGYDLLDSLRQFHETYREEPLHTMRVRLSDVYDEFGWGVHDVVAIRNFLKYAATMWQGQSLKYVLLVGAGDYDYRNIESQADANWMPPWEYDSDCRDDFYGLFANSASLPAVRLGRWTVRGNGELQNIISKTIAYGAHPFYGPWKNTATFAADDEWKGGSAAEHMHSQQAESLITTVLPQYFTFRKIYEILYPFHSSPLGSVKPDATRDLIEAINNGTLVVNFTGHGNATTWTDEQLFVMDRDQNLLHNGRKWPFYMAATCSWGLYDRPVGRCFPDVMLADPTDGAVMSVAATRFTFAGSNQNFLVAFYDDLFAQGLTARRSFGDALLAGKFVDGNGSGTMYYHCLGDPALRLATPEFFARVSPSSDDTLHALSLFNLNGEVSQTKDGDVWSDFRGVVEARVFDTQDSGVYYWADTGAPFYYGLPGNAIFRGTATVDSGRFHVTFRVPRDIHFGGTNAKISLYFYGADNARGADSADGIGIEEHIPIANRPSAEQDTTPPTISAWLEVPSFRPGDVVSGTPKLHVSIADSSGINLSGEVGHKITGRIDESQTEDLTSFFNYDLDKHTTGSLDKTIGPLTVGEHRLVIEAWDSFNNLSQSTLNFTVGASGEAGYAIHDVYNWPNPMKDVTYFTYYLTEDGTRRVDIKVYTLTSKLVYELDGLGTRGPAFNSNSDRPWDGRDREGHLLGNGVYFYRIKAEHTNGHSAEATGKLVILR
jgi:hypothetical protein